MSCSSFYLLESSLIRLDLDPLCHNLQAITPQVLQHLLSNLLQDPTLTLETVQPLLEVWGQWLKHLHVIRIGAVADNGKEPKSILESQPTLIFLDKEVEDAVDTAWHSSPFRGLLYDATAKGILMRAVSDLLPQIGAKGCAPIPVLSSTQQEMLWQEGLLRHSSNTLTRRYSVLTYMPYRGGCDICALQETCEIF